MAMCGSFKRIPLTVRPTPLWSSVSKESSLRRFVSTTNGTSSKLKTVLNEYRQEHYRQCLPSRFRKEILNAISQNNKREEVTPEDILTFLKKIGKDQSVSHAELVKSLGGESTVSVDKFKSLLN